MIFHNGFQCFLLPEVVSYDNIFLIFSFDDARVEKHKRSKRERLYRKKEMFMVAAAGKKENCEIFTSRKLRNIFSRFHIVQQLLTNSSGELIRELRGKCTIKSPCLAITVLYVMFVLSSTFSRYHNHVIRLI